MRALPSHMPVLGPHGYRLFLDGVEVIGSATVENQYLVEYTTLRTDRPIPGVEPFSVSEMPGRERQYTYRGSITSVDGDKVFMSSVAA